MEFHSRGGGGISPQGPIPKKKSYKKIPKEEVDWVEVPSSPTASRARAMYQTWVSDFRPMERRACGCGVRMQVCLATFRTGEYVGEIEGTGIERIERRV